MKYKTEDEITAALIKLGQAITEAVQECGPFMVLNYVLQEMASIVRHTNNNIIQAELERAGTKDVVEAQAPSATLN